MNLQTLVNQAFAHMQTVLPTCVATYEGEICNDAIQHSIASERVVALYGTREGYNFSVRVPGGAFTAPVKAGKRVTIGETTYRIIGMQEDATGGTIRIDIGDQFG